MLFSCAEEKVETQQSNNNVEFVNGKLSNAHARYNWWRIASFDWGRESLSCNGGFGVCNWNWFPDWKPTSVPPKGLIYAPFYYNQETDSFYAEFLIKKNSLIEKYFFVDKDIVNQLEKDNEAITLILKKGVYKFNPLIGNNGGYRILAIKKL